MKIIERGKSGYLVVKNTIDYYGQTISYTYRVHNGHFTVKEFDVDDISEEAYEIVQRLIQKDVGYVDKEDYFQMHPHRAFYFGIFSHLGKKIHYTFDHHFNYVYPARSLRSFMDNDELASIEPLILNHLAQNYPLEQCKIIYEC